MAMIDDYRAMMNERKYGSGCDQIAWDYRRLEKMKRETWRKVEKALDDDREGDAEKLAREYVDMKTTAAFVAGMIRGRDDYRNARPNRNIEANHLQMELNKAREENRWAWKCWREEREEKEGLRDLANDFEWYKNECDNLIKEVDRLRDSRELMKAGYRRYIASLKARIEELEKPQPTFWQRLKVLF